MNPRRRRRLSLQRRDLEPVNRFSEAHDQSILVGHARRRLRRSVHAIRQGRRPWAAARRMLEQFRLRTILSCRYQLFEQRKHSYPCRVEGCVSVSSYYARGNDAHFGHLCPAHWLALSTTERSLYAYGEAASP